MTMWGNMRSDFGKGMNVPVTVAKECSYSFFSPALHLVFIVVVCCPLSPLSSSSLSRALFDCCVCFCHCCHCGCRPNLTPRRRQAAAAAVPPKLLLPPPRCHPRCRPHCCAAAAATPPSCRAAVKLPPPLQGRGGGMQ